MVHTRHSRRPAVTFVVALCVLLATHLSFLDAVQPATALRLLGLQAGLGTQTVIERWVNKTGKTLDASLKPIAGFMAEVKQDMKQGLNLFDIYEINQAGTEFADKGWIHELTEYVREPRFKWNEIALASRKWQTEYDNKVWTVPIDSDSYLLYYRRDLIASPPSTWEEYLEVAKEWHGKDINGDGIPDFGACTITEGQFTQLAFAVAATVMKHKKGNRQGYTHDVSDRDDELMTELFETEGWSYVMNMVKEIWKYGQGEPVTVAKAYGQFRDGRCATYISYPSAATQTVAPGSYINGKLGVARAPGAKKIYNRETKTLTPCDPDLCPFMEAGSINRPSYITGGVMLLINSNVQGADLQDALDFAAFATNEVDVRRPGGLNPYREAHFNASWYPEAERPWDKMDAELYTAALRNVIDSPHTVATTRLPTAQIIMMNVERAIKEHVRLEPYNASTDELPTILSNLNKRINEESIADGYNALILEELMRKGMSLPPYAPADNSKEFPYWIISIIIVVVALAGTAAHFALQKSMKTRYAPKNDKESFSALFIGPKNISELWQRFPDQVPDAQVLFKDIVRKAIKGNGCYEARRIGDFFLIVAVDPAKLVNAATEINTSLNDVLWNEIFAHSNTRSVRSGQKAATRKGDDTASASSRNSRASRRSRQNDSDNTSHRSGRDGATSNGAWSEQTRFKVGAGFAYGRGRIAFDEELNHYDYSGAVVEDAAFIADVAQPNQLLAMETVSSVIDENDSNVRGTFVDFCEKTLKGSNVTEKLMQFNQADLIPKTFALPEDGEVVDSVMQALEQAAGGLTKKRITVLNVKIHEFNAKTTATLSRDAVSKKYNEIYDIVFDEVRASRGFIHRFEEGEFVITFNAVNPTAGHTFRAGVCAMDILHRLRETGYEEVSCGFDTGMEWVGSMASRGDQPPHQGAVGAVSEHARALAQRCKALSSTAGGLPVACLTTSRCRDDLATALFYQYIDVVPGTTSANPSPAPLGLLSIVARKKTDEAESDEWIYELQNQDAGDPFMKMNKVFENLLIGTRPENEEEMAAVFTDVDGQGTTAAVFERAKAIAAASSVDEYVGAVKSAA